MTCRSRHHVDRWSEGEPAGPRRRPHGRPRRAGGLLFAALLITASLASTAQAASVPLGTADSFAVLAGSTVTNTGPSVISGDLGLSPGTAVTGFPPGTVNAGTIHAADSVALQAQSDLTTAYTDAAGSSSTATISADLAGRTLTPGVYTSASSLGLSGDLTLDAQGNPNAVFVFQAGSTLTTGSGEPSAHRRGASLQRVLAGRQLGDDRHEQRVRRKHLGADLDLADYRRDAGRERAARNGAVTSTPTPSPRRHARPRPRRRPPAACLPVLPAARPAVAPEPARRPAPRPPGCEGRMAASAVRSRSASRAARSPRSRFFVDGRRRQTVNAKEGRTVFLLRVNPRGQDSGTHRITARVRFSAASGAKARRLHFVYVRCSNVAAGPRFTG